MTMKHLRINAKLLSTLFLSAALIQNVSASNDDVVVLYKLDLRPSTQSMHFHELTQMPHHDSVRQTFSELLSSGKDFQLDPIYDLIDRQDIVYNQGQLGSCTANATVGGL